MTDRELEELIVWFEDLKRSFEDGDYDVVQTEIDAAIKVLWKDKESRTKPVARI